MTPPVQHSARQRESILIFFFAVAFWLLENMYFGWNAKPVTKAEGVADMIVLLLLFLAYLWKPVSHDVTIHNSGQIIYKNP